MTAAPTPADLAVAVLAAVVVGQATMSAVLLTPRRAGVPMHRWLLLFLLSVALVSAGDLVEHLRGQAALWWLLPFASAALLLVGPALWLYTLEVTRPAGAPRAPGWRRTLHLVPAVLLAVLLALDAAGERAAEQAAAFDGAAHRSPGELVLLVPVALQLSAYLVAVIRRVRRTRQALKQGYSTLDGRTLAWMQATALLLGAVVLCWLWSWRFTLATSNLLTNGLSAVVLLVVGRAGVGQRNVFARLQRVPRAEHEAAPAADAEPAGAPPAEADAPPADEPPTPKYARAALGAQTQQRLAAELQRVMALDKPYLENDLTLADLAQRIGATPHQLSQLLSQHLGETFFDFVNRHRVEAVKATLARPQSARRPLLEVALECGFGSKSTFNQAFRKATGMSPSEYRGRSLAGSGAAAPG
jgi:AraC-like DNA-binding protein